MTVKHIGLGKMSVIFFVTYYRYIHFSSAIIGVQDKVENYFLRDDVSRPFPGLKNKISIKLSNGVRQHFQKRLLLAPLETLHKQYIDMCQNEQDIISFTSFWKLRPRQCVYSDDSSAMNVCVCMIHENMKFMFDALNKTNCFRDSPMTSNLDSFLINKILCKDSTDDCYLRSCEECNSKNIIDFVAEHLDKHNIEHIKYCFWIISPRCEIINKEDNVNDFLENLQVQAEKFIVHKFTQVEQQTKFIRMRKESLVPQKELMCQMDFAENYSCVVQDAIQSHYFVRPQVTIHPFVIFYNDESTLKVLNFVVIADIKKHNTISVYAFQKKLLFLLKNKFPELEKIIYLSDGCAEQYKNKSNFKNLCCHEKDFNIKAEWHFFPTSHGKGPCDGIGGNIKRMARDASIRKTAEINSAKQFFDWATSQEVKRQFKKDWEFIYATDEDYSDAEDILQERFCNLVTIPGTKKFHAYIPRDEQSIYASEYSDQSENVENKVYFPLNSSKKRKSSTVTKPKRCSRIKN